MSNAWWMPDRPLTDAEWAASGSFAETRTEAEAERFNPYHGEHGLFTTGGSNSTGITTQQVKTAIPVESHRVILEQTARQQARVAKAEAQIQKALPNAEVDLKGMEPKLAEETADAMVQFNKDYPGAASSIQNVRIAEPWEFGGDAQGVVAQTSPNVDNKVTVEGTVQPEDVSGYSVMLNETYFEQGSLRSTNAMMKHDGPSGSGFHPGDTPEYAIQHELGHVLDNHIAQAGGDRPSNQLVDRLFSVNNIKGDSAGVGADKIVPFMRDTMGTTAVGYATTGGPQEAFAEMFAVAEGGHESQLSEWGRSLIDNAKSADHGLGLVANRSGWARSDTIGSSCGGFISPEAQAVFQAEKAAEKANG